MPTEPSNVSILIPTKSNNGMESAEFSYEPLQRGSLRLLRFSPESTSDAISLTLKHCESSRAKYLALSYCWGNSSSDRTLILNGRELPVTENMYQALRCIWAHHWSALRSSSDGVETYLWVDALCINQADLQEKNVQVAKMWQIYARAWKVIAWVGPADANTDSFFAKIATDFADGRSIIDDWPDDGIRLQYWRILKSGHEVWRGLDGILRSAYFERTWILTEIAQARELLIICGGYWCWWQLLRRIFRYHNIGSDRISLHESLAHARDHHLYVMQMGSSGRAETSLIKLFELYGSSKCADNRDRLFAMGGHPFSRILDPEGYLKPDYTLSAQEVLFSALDWIAHLRRIGRLWFSPSDPFANASIYLEMLESALGLVIPVSRCSANNDHKGLWDWALDNFDEDCFDQDRRLLKLRNGRTIDCSVDLISHLLWTDDRVANVSRRRSCFGLRGKRNAMNMSSPSTACSICSRMRY